MTQTLTQLGEKKLLQELKRYMGNAEGIIRTFSEDTAVIDPGGRFYQLFTVDSLVEGVHFRRDYMPFFYVGRKAIKVNLSDIASMGGTPNYYLVSLGLPPDTPVQVIEDIYEGMYSVAKDLNVYLIGGNVSAAAQLFIDITLIGTVLKNKIVQRDGARNGDPIFVTGQLGNSAVGLNLLKEGFRLFGDGLIFPKGERDSHLVQDAIMNHIDPPCLIDLAQKLAMTSTVTSMIDLSDGLSSDLPEICRESKVGARLDMEKLPIAPAALYWERKRNRDPRILALHGGEDYHLLFTVNKKFREIFMRRIKPQKIIVYEIGQIVPRSEGIHVVDAAGTKYPVEGGFQHFQEKQ
jgi:thiamine-monophosphate kinase